MKTTWPILIFLLIKPPVLLGHDGVPESIKTNLTREELETNIELALAHPALSLLQDQYWYWDESGDMHLPIPPGQQGNEFLVVPGQGPSTFDEETKACLSKKNMGAKGALKGLHVALDPGHFGGAYARLEDRFVDFAEPETMAFNEGNLTMGLALKLKQMLERAGAKVSLTRSPESPFPLGMNFEVWKRTQMQEYWGQMFEEKNLRPPTQAEKMSAMLELMEQEKAAFSIYNRADLEKRAAILADLGADLTLYLHFNGSEKKPTRDESGHTIAKEENFNMGFIAGSFLPNEISTEQDRRDFIRWMTSPGKLTLSKKLCSSMLDRLEKRTDVPLARQTDAAYLQVSSIPAVNEIGENYEGVYHRNLLLTRRSTTTHCYLESLVQDNLQEAQKLSKKNRQIQGVSSNARVFKVAKAYFNGIKKFAEQNVCKIKP